MIRLFGFLTGVIVTGTVLLLLTDEMALESADHAAQQLAARLRTPVTAEDHSFAATPRPDDLRAGPGWAAAESTPARAPASPSADAVRVPVEETVAGDRDALPPADNDAEPVTATRLKTGSEITEPAPSDADASTPGTADPVEPARSPMVNDVVAAPDGTGQSEPETDLPAQVPTRAPAAGESSGDADPSSEGQWYAFWTPFRSRASAQGFANHIGAATGQEIRVLRMGAGEYRVAFFHSGEDERQQQLALLEQASGLTLGGEL